MTIDLINQDDLPIPSAYTHVAGAAGTRLVFVAGRVAEDARWLSAAGATVAA